MCNIGIDEFAVKKGHIYKTIVVDLDTGRILHVGDGKGVGALGSFWKRVKWHNVQIEHVATDLSAAFIASVLENCPKAVHVFEDQALANPRLGTPLHPFSAFSERRHIPISRLRPSTPCWLCSAMNEVTINGKRETCHPTNQDRIPLCH